MNHLTPEQRFQIVEIYFEKNKSVREVYRALRPFYGEHNRPSEQAIRAVIDRFCTNFTLLDSKPSTRQRNVRTEENIAAVARSVEEDAEMSIRRRSQLVGLCPSTTWKILRKDLGLRAYKIQLVQELKPNDHRLRRIFADWAHLKLAEDEHFYRRIVFSDEAHFWLNGYVNKQNCRIWSEDNPQAVNESPLHPLKLTVWCGLHAGGIIGPYFFRNEEGAAVTVNGERYRAMLTEFLFPEINQLNIDDIWFQQDGATCHTARLTIDLLQNQFGDNFLSRSGPVNWPPRSCDLTPLDYFLWGYVKSLVYTDKPATLEALEANIQATIDAIRPDLLEKVVKNWTDRMDHVTRSRGGHMPEIIFKK
jgi:hypothetical protein